MCAYRTPIIHLFSQRCEVDKGRGFDRGEYRVAGAHFLVRFLGPLPLTRSFCSYSTSALSTSRPPAGTASTPASTPAPRTAAQLAPIPRLAPSLPLSPTSISLPPPSPRSSLATGSVAPLTAMFPPGRPLLDYLHQDLRHHGHQDSLCHSILTHASCVVVQKRKRQPPLSRLSLVP